MRVVYVSVVLVLGFFNFLVGIPVGYAFDLSPATIYLASLVGCVGGTVGLVFVGDRLLPPLRRAWRAITRRMFPGREQEKFGPERESRRSAWVSGITERHGAIVLGLVGPWVIGGPATALLGVGLDLRRRDLAVGLATSLSAMLTGYMLIMHAALS